jgi:hypothetical protein
MLMNDVFDLRTKTWHNKPRKSIPDVAEIDAAVGKKVPYTVTDEQIIFEEPLSPAEKDAVEELFEEEV